MLILLSLHYIFFGVILAFLARDAWRYNVRRIIALREDAKTQVSMQARRECVKAQGRRQSARVLCGHSAECWLGLSIAIALVHVYRTVLHGFALC